MDDDLNTPKAMAALFDLVHEINRGVEKGQGVDKAQSTLRRLGDVLGVTFTGPMAENGLPLEPLAELFREVGSLLNASGNHRLAGWVDPRFGGDGAIHHGFMDISMFRVFPSVALLAASDEPNLRAALEFMRQYDSGASFLRYPRDSVPIQPLAAEVPPRRSA